MDEHGIRLSNGEPVAGPVMRRIGLDDLGAEPFRVLFPLGALLGVYGVMLWPAFVYQWIPFYPATLHARIMVQGFLFAFIAGFIGTALPHMLEVKSMSLKEAGVLTGGLVLVVFVHHTPLSPFADLLFTALILSLPYGLLHRWSSRKDLPPPGFAMVTMGLLAGAFGSCMLAWNAMAPLSDEAYRFAKLLLYQGLPLFPVLGIGVYLFPRLIGAPNIHLIPKSPTASPAWKRRAMLMGGWGALLLASLGLEAMGLARAGFILRTAIIATILVSEIPIHRAQGIRGSIPWGALTVWFSITLGFLALAIWPAWAMTYIHAVFISGIGLLALLFGARVMIAHGGRPEGVFHRLPLMLWMIGLIWLAMATRVSADLIPAMRWSHYAYAAITWAVATVLWFVQCLPFLTRAPPNGDAH